MNVNPDSKDNRKLLLQSIQQGDTRTLARCISFVENEVPGYSELLEELPDQEPATILGITGPPGAGKSTLVDLLIGNFTAEEKKVGVLCVDPSSQFHLGALLGDRVRMSEWYNHPRVFIRSLASRGSLGGLHPKIIEITDLLKAAGFDCIIIETVGVGQSEIEIAGLADLTIVVLVPEAGDEIQNMKAGLAEIADIFVVNKSDRPGADHFASNLRRMTGADFKKNAQEIPVIQTIASQKKGLPELMQKILEQYPFAAAPQRKTILLAEKAYQLLLYKKMKDISKKELRDKISQELKKENFNLYKFVAAW
jgi:LAO/AO transport system kinase